MANVVILQGMLERDPEVRHVNGKVVANLNMSTPDPFRSSDSGKEPKDYHDVVAWSGLGEKAAALKKGDCVFIQGRLKKRSWDDIKTGQKRYATEVVASEITAFQSGAVIQLPTTGRGPTAGAGMQPAAGSSNAPMRNDGYVPGGDDIPF